MPKSYSFTVKHYPVNELLELDLETHLNQMADAGWELVSTEPLVNAHSTTTPQLIFFWAKDKEE
jgi:hypothetical protein